MTQTTLLVAALAAMFISSLGSAGLLHWLGASAPWVIAGGTGAGVFLYIAILMIGKKHLLAETMVEGQDNA
jgi:hypothetical protein